MAAKKKTSETLEKTVLTVKQYGSPIRRDSRQRLYLKSLGLGKVNAVRQLEDNQTVRGLLAKLPHMVKIISE